MALRLFKMTVPNPFTHYRKYCIRPISTIFVEETLNYLGRLQAAWSDSHELQRAWQNLALKMTSHYLGLK